MYYEKPELLILGIAASGVRIQNGSDAGPDHKMHSVFEHGTLDTDFANSTSSTSGAYEADE